VGAPLDPLPSPAGGGGSRGGGLLPIPGLGRVAPPVMLQPCLLAAQWGSDRVPYRSANPLQWRVADCLQVWKSGRVSHEQHDFLQQRSTEQLIVVHLCKKNGGPVLFFYGKHRDGARILCQKVPA